MMRFVDYPDEVLFAVADEIRDLVACGKLKEQPRFDALKKMADAAQSAQDALVALLGERSLRRAG